MLDIKYIRENTDIVRNAIKVKKCFCDLDKLLDLDSQILKLKNELQGYNENINSLSKRISLVSNNEKQELIDQSKSFGLLAKSIEEQLNNLIPEFNNLIRSVPQIPDSDVVIGDDDNDNIVIKTHGEKTNFDFEPKDQIELIKLNDWADFDRIVNVSGTRTLALKGDLARLEIALHLYVLDKLNDIGFKQISVPSLCSVDAIFNAGHFSGNDEIIMQDDVYKIEKDNLCLAGTSEIIINSLYQGEILNESDLPILYAGYSPCFRREAGSAGKDTKGLIRVHQFMKVEEFVICKNDINESRYYHKLLHETMEQLLVDMNIPYQVIEACTGDMGFNKIRMNDVEAWIPSQNKYREVSSTSTIGEFQARRTNLRYRENGSGNVKFCHTLNSTGIATPRFLVAFIENNQNKDGSVNIPEKLRAYMNGKVKIGGLSK